MFHDVWHTHAFDLSCGCFNADVPHLGPRVGGEGNPHVKSKIFLQLGVLVQLCPLLELLIVVTCAFEGRAMDAGLSDRLRNKRDSSALDEHLLHAVRTVTTKQPWERGDILSPRPLFAAPYPCVGRPQIAVQTASSSARLEMAKPCFLGLPKGVCRMQRGGGRAPFHKFLICMILHEFRCMIDFIGCAIFSFVTWIIDWMNLQHKGSRGGSLVLERWGRDHGATPWPQLLWKPAEAERGGISSQPSGLRACGRGFHSL